jgi:hypothetical protein
MYRERVCTAVETFEAALAAGRWMDALEAFRGDFLRGFHFNESHGFEEWMDGERARLRQEAARATWIGVRAPFGIGDSRG